MLSFCAVRRANRVPQPSETLATQIADAPESTLPSIEPTTPIEAAAYPEPEASSTTKVIGQLTAVPLHTTIITPNLTVPSTILPTLQPAETPNVFYFPVVAGRPRPTPRPTNTPIPQPTVAPQTAPTNPPPTTCLLYTSPSPRDLSTSRMPSSA